MRVDVDHWSGAANKAIYSGGTAAVGAHVAQFVLSRIPLLHGAAPHMSFAELTIFGFGCGSAGYALGAGGRFALRGLGGFLNASLSRPNGPR